MRFADIRKSFYKLGAEVEPIGEIATPRFLSVRTPDGQIKADVDKAQVPGPTHNRASRRRGRKPLRPRNLRRLARENNNVSAG